MPTDRTAPARRGNPNWTKGVSGNPGGRPKAVVEVQELARLETAASIAALVRIRDAEDTPPAAVVAAATALLDRAWGRPVQSHELHHHLEPQHMTDAELIALAATAAVSTADEDDPERPSPLH
jgi:hypothetical protein